MGALRGRSFPGSGWGNCGQPSLFSFKEGLDPGMLSGGGGVRSTGSSNWRGQHEGSSECILSAWGGWHRERLRMEREE